MRGAWLGGLALVTLLAACATPVPEAPPAVVSQPPAAVTEPEEAHATASEKQASLAENRIFFSPGGTQVDSAGRRKLEAHALMLKADAKLIVTLVGMTDDLGSRAYKLAIAEQRVNAVFKVLRKLGVPARQIRRYAVGMETAAGGCFTAECRQAMRRVELRYR